MNTPELIHAGMLGMNDEPQCRCVYPQDNDKGFCMNCGRWINYREMNVV